MAPMHLIFVSLFAIISSYIAEGSMYEGLVKPPGEDDSSIYPLPSLPYGYADLEPHIDEQTLRVHYLGHHKSYTNKMNAALVEWRKKVCHYQCNRLM